MKRLPLPGGNARGWAPDRIAARLLASTAVPALLAATAIGAAAQPTLPQGGQVVAGAATIASSGSEMTVTQTSSRAVVTWNDFSIGKGYGVNVAQPDASSIEVEQVTGANVSQIFGSLSSNGKLVVANPNGIWFGPNAQVNVAGLTATTATASATDINNFWAGGNLTLSQAGNATASVINRGRITITQAGLAAFVAPGVRNSGVIEARLGTVQLSSGTTATLDFYGDGLINIAVTGQTLAQAVGPHGKPLKAAVSNSGTINADGGTVLLTANVAAGVVDQVINTAGVVQARAVSQQGGEIVLDGGGTGNVVVAGSLDASGLAAGQTGGTVNVLGDNVTLRGTASIDVAGDAGGGTVLIGGNFHGAGPQRDAGTTRIAKGATIDASAVTSGNGGNVAVWSNGSTRFAGTITAAGGAAGGNGGYVETSGAQLRVAQTASVDAGAAHGTAGTWLLDPNNITIASSGGDITPTTILTALSSGNVEIDTVDDPGAAGTAGTILVNSALTYNSANSLSLLAQGDIDVNASIQNSGSGNINLVAGWDGSTGLTGGSAGAYTGTVGIGAITSAPGAYGNSIAGASGSVLIGDGSQTSGIAVGSANGTTTVAANNVILSGGGTGDFAQLGYNLSASAISTSGNITVLAAGNVTLAGGSGTGAFAQIGDGGYQAESGLSSGGSPTISGSISVSAGGSGGIALTAGTGAAAYAQIGHGGYQLGDGSTFTAVSVGGGITISAGSGGVRLTADQSSSNSEGYAQIGNGGDQAFLRATVSGSGGDVGAISIDTSGGVSLAGGSGAHDYAQIGDGGFDSARALLLNSGAGSFANSGDITLGAARVTLTGGNSGGNTDAYAQIGSGGDQSFVFANLRGGAGSGNFGDISITVTGGAISVAAGSGTTAYAQIGDGGFSAAVGLSLSSGTGSFENSGNITLSAASLALTGGSSGSLPNAYAQIGDGGMQAAESATFSGSGSSGDFGNISISVSGAVSLVGGTTTSTGGGTYGQIGDGGYQSAESLSGSFGNSGTITLTAGSLTLAGGSGVATYAQIGQGDETKSGGGSDTGNIDLSISGTLVGTTGSYQIGDATATANGITNANVFIEAAALNLGSDSAFWNGVTSDLAGGAVAVAITGTGGLTLPALSYTSTNSLSLLSQSDVDFSASLQNAGTGVINIVAGWDGSTGVSEGSFIFASLTTTTGSYGHAGAGNVNIGSGTQTAGIAVGSANGATNVAADNVTLSGGSTAGAYAQLGYYADTPSNVSAGALSASGAITVLATGNVTLAGGSGGETADFVSAYAQIGHGGGGTEITGSVASQSLAGSITITAGGAVSLDAGSGSGDYAQIGHGGLRFGDGLTFTTASITGGITVTAGGGVALSSPGGSVNDNYAQIGLGGDSAFQSATIGSLTVGGVGSDISVTASGGNIALSGGTTSSSTHPGAYAQIGDGGTFFAFVAKITGTATLGGENIRVVASQGNVTLTGGTTTNGNYYAQIGDGGSGDVFGQASGTPRITLGSTGGTISVTAGGTISLAGGSGSGSDAQIGEGGYQFASSTATTGAVAIADTIVVAAGGNLALTGESSNAYAQIGSGDNTGAAAAVSGNIDVSVGGTLTTSSSGSSSADYAIGQEPGTGGTVSSSNVYVAAQTLVADGATDSISISNGSNFANMLQHDLDANAGEVVLALGDGFSIGGLSYSGSGPLGLLSQHELTTTGALANSGSGAIVLVGGWNGSAGASSTTSGGAFDLTTDSSGALSSGSYGVGSDGVSLGGNVSAAATSGLAVALAGPAQLLATVTLQASGGLIEFFSTLAGNRNNLTVIDNAAPEFAGAVSGLANVTLAPSTATNTIAVGDSSLAAANTSYDFSTGAAGGLHQLEAAGAVTGTLSIGLAGDSGTITMSGFSPSLNLALVNGGTGAIDVTGTYNGTGSLALASGSGGISLSGSGTIATTGGQTYSGAVTLGANATLSDTSGGSITFASTVDGGFALTSSTTGVTTFSGAVGSRTALASLGVSGPAALDGGSVMTTGGQTYSGAVTLGANTVLSDSGSGITFAGTVGSDAPATPRSLTVSGDVSFGGAVGSSDPLNALTVTGTTSFGANAGSVTTSGAQSYGGAVTVNGNLDLISTGDGSAGALVSLGAVSGGGHTLTVSTGAGGLTLNGVTLGGLVTSAVSGTETLESGSYSIASPSPYSFGNSTGATRLSGTLSLGQATTFSGAVTLGGNTTLSDSAGAIVFAGAVSGAGQSLVVTSGATTFDGAVTVGSVATQAVALDGGSVATSGGQSYGAATLGANTTLSDSASGAITFGGTLSGGAQGLTVTTGGMLILRSGASSLDAFNSAGAGLTVFDGAVGAASVTTGAVSLDGGSVATSGGQSYGAATLAAATTLSDGNSGAITFGGTLSGGSQDLTVTTGGTLTLTSGVSSLGALNSVGAGQTVFDGAVNAVSVTTGAASLDGGSITTTGSQTYSGAVTLAANAMLSDSGSGIVFESTVSDGGQGDALDVAQGTTTFSGAVSLGSLQTQAVTLALSSGSIATSGGQTYSGAATLGADTTLSDSAGGAITFGSTLSGGSHNLTVTDSGGTLTLTSGASSLRGFNSAGAALTVFDGAVNAASVTTGAVSLDGGSVSTTGAQSYSGTVALGGNTSLTTTNSLVTLGPVSGTGDRLAVNSGSGGVTLDGVTVGALTLTTTGIETLDAGTYTIGAAGSAYSYSSPGGVTLNGALTLGNATSFGAAVTLGSNTTLSDSGGTIAFDSTIGGAGEMLAITQGTVTFSGGATLGALQTEAATLALSSGTTIATTGGQTYSGAVTLGSNATLADSSASGIVFASTIGGAGETLAITQGTVTFAGGVTLGALQTQAATLALPSGATIATTGGQTYSGAVTLDANASLSASAGGITFDGTVSGATLTLTANAGNDGVTFNGIDLAALSVSTSGTETLNSGSYTIGSGSSYSFGATTLSGSLIFGQSTGFGAAMLAADTALATLGAGESLSFNGTLSGGSHSLTATDAGGTLTLSAGASNLGTFNSAGTGLTVLGGAVSAARVTTGAVSLDGSVATSGGQSYGAAVLGGNTALSDSAGGAINFAGTLDGGSHSLTVTDGGGTLTLSSGASSLGAFNSAGTGQTVFGGAVTAASVATGAVALDGGSVTTSGGQSYGAATLGADTALADTGAGAIAFTSTVDGAHALTLSTAGAASFAGAVTVASLTLANSAGTTTLGSGVGSMATTGDQLYGNALTLAGNISIATSGGNVTFGGTIAGRGVDLTLDLGGAGSLVLEGDAGSAAARLGTMTVRSGADVTIANGATAYVVTFVESGVSGTTNFGRTLNATGNATTDSPAVIGDVDVGALTVNNASIFNVGPAVNATLATGSVAGFIDAPGAARISFVGGVNTGGWTFDGIGIRGAPLLVTGVDDVPSVSTFHLESALATTLANPGASLAVGGANSAAGQINPQAGCQATQKDASGNCLIEPSSGPLVPPTIDEGNAFLRGPGGPL